VKEDDVTGEPAEPSVIPDSARSMLKGLPLGYLASVRPDGGLSVVPVGVMLDQDVLRISTPARTYKVRNLERDSRVTVCIPNPEDPRQYVQIRGTAELVDDVDRSFINLIARKFLNADEYPCESSRVRRKIIVVRPEHVSVQRAQSSGR
jgi:PPOX class probable F420-dependent enzyme